MTRLSHFPSRTLYRLNRAFTLSQVALKPRSHLGTLMFQSSFQCIRRVTTSINRKTTSTLTFNKKKIRMDLLALSRPSYRLPSLKSQMQSNFPKPESVTLRQSTRLWPRLSPCQGTLTPLRSGGELETSILCKAIPPQNGEKQPHLKIRKTAPKAFINRLWKS